MKTNKNNYKATLVMLNRIHNDLHYMQSILDSIIDDKTKLELINDIAKTVVDNIPKISTYFINESGMETVNKTTKGDKNK